VYCNNVRCAYGLAQDRLYLRTNPDRRQPFGAAGAANGVPVIASTDLGLPPVARNPPLTVERHLISGNGVTTMKRTKPPSEKVGAAQLSCNRHSCSHSCWRLLALAYRQPAIWVAKN